MPKNRGDLRRHRRPRFNRHGEAVPPLGRDVAPVRRPRRQPHRGQNRPVSIQRRMAPRRSPGTSSGARRVSGGKMSCHSPDTPSRSRGRAAMSQWTTPGSHIRVVRAVSRVPMKLRWAPLLGFRTPTRRRTPLGRCGQELRRHSFKRPRRRVGTAAFCCSPPPHTAPALRPRRQHG